MPRTRRTTSRDAFASHEDFDGQLYDALRASPWWMISIGAHVLLFVVSTLFAGDPPAPTTARNEVVVQVPPSTNQPPEPPSRIDDPDPSPPVVPVDAYAKDPELREVDPSERPETDVDEPFEEPYGDGSGYMDAPFESIGDNKFVGTGASAGGSLAGRGGRRNTGTRGGPTGHEKMNDAVEDALRWLAAHQSADGGWEGAGFPQWCDGKRVEGAHLDGLGKASYDVGLTGLSLLAFLGAGYTHRGDHPFAQVVSKGLRYLKNAQDPEGCLGARTAQHYLYNHAIGSLALVEAYGMTGSAVWRGPAQKSLDFISIARNPYYAWRYGIKPGDNDTSVTGWMMMALKSAALTNASGHGKPLAFDAEAFDGIRTWIDKVTDEYGRVGYLSRGSGPARTPDMMDRFPAEKSESMTGVGMLARIFLGEDPKKSEPIQKGVRLCLQRLPAWEEDGSIDMYYWYYATLAMYQVGGDAWSRWLAALKTAVVDTQRKDGGYCDAKGSWDPKDPWGPDGGRVYSTATLALCLEAYYRYERAFGLRSEPTAR
jgi:hypothetical protein